MIIIKNTRVTITAQIKAKTAKNVMVIILTNGERLLNQRINFLMVLFLYSLNVSLKPTSIGGGVLDILLFVSATA